MPRRTPISSSVTWFTAVAATTLIIVGFVVLLLSVERWYAWLPPLVIGPLCLGAAITILRRKRG